MTAHAVTRPRRILRLLPLAGLLLALQLGACAPRLQPPGDAALPPVLDVANGDWRADDGRILPLRSWQPEGKPKAVILALHGFNDYAHAFAQAAVKDTSTLVPLMYCMFLLLILGTEDHRRSLH